MTPEQESQLVSYAKAMLAAGKVHWLSVGPEFAQALGPVLDVDGSKYCVTADGDVVRVVKPEFKKQ